MAYYNFEIWRFISKNISLITKLISYFVVVIVCNIGVQKQTRKVKSHFKNGLSTLKWYIVLLIVLW